MNKLFITLCLFFSLQALSQSAMPEYGTIVPEEIKIKQCSFDQEADAVVLLDKAISTYNEEKHLITKRRIKFKILKESGITRGDLRILYYSG